MGWFKESIAKLSGPKRPCSNIVPKTKTGLLLLVNVSAACREGQRPVRASCNCASASWRPAAVTFMDGFVRSAISTACVRVNCSVGSDSREAVWEFAVVENGPPLTKTSKHNVTEQQRSKYETSGYQAQVSFDIH